VHKKETLEETLRRKRDSLEPEKRALLEKRLRAEVENAGEASPVIPRRTGRKPARLTFAQARLWFLFEWDPQSPAYNEAFATHIKGALDSKALEKAFLEMARRHEILRTTYQVLEDEPVQLVASSIEWHLPLIDLSQLPGEVREAETRRLTHEEAVRPFDLCRELPWRATLIRLGKNEHVVLTTQHHISCDGWSASVRSHELGTLYDAFKAGSVSPLPDLPVQFADFAEWQRLQVQGPRIEELRSYWRLKLAGLTPLQIPTDRLRVPAWTGHGRMQCTPLPVDFTNAIHQLGQKEQVTSFVVCLSAFNVLLHRYARQTDLLMGTLVTNREHPELEKLIGFFVDLLVLRNDLSGNPTFRTLLHRVRQVVLEAHANKDLPLEYIIADLRIKRDTNSEPFIQVLFSWEDWQQIAPQRSGFHNLEFRELGRTLTETAKFDLTLSMQKLDGVIKCFWEYNTDLFDDCTITQLAEHFTTLFGAALAKPDMRISDLPLLTLQEQQCLLRSWNQPQVVRESLPYVFQMFEAQVAVAPQATAVICDGQTLTYHQLSQRAKQLSSYLRSLGVGPDVLVGILLEPGPDVVVCLLGVMMAGGAYLPLDPLAPAERATRILAESQARVLLTQRHLHGLLGDVRARVCCLDISDEAFATTPSAEIATDVTPANLAYVIYTSGSTGMPKGVMIPHSALSHYTLSACAKFQLTPADRVLQFASISFDTAAEEIYPTLASGGTLVLRTEQMLGSTRTFLRSCGEQCITVLDLPTAYWHELTREMSDPTVLLPRAVRLVIIGGERAIPEYWVLWQTYVGGRVRLLNTYGPTESTIVALASELSEREAEKAREVPIGRPITNVQAYVLDEHLQLVPVGVPGELYVGGVGLARGYLNRPDLTAERFVPDRFNGEPGARLYRTGDLARYLPDGNIEFLGRIDRQVKIRGFRVELGEVEAMLSQHPAVKQVAVVAREDVPGTRRLLAYVVPVQDQGPTSGELRHFLKQKLPEYMVPSAYVVLEVLPLTSSSKVDYRALLISAGTRPTLKQAFVSPRTSAEEVLARIWAEVLKLERVSIHDNFFELGGDSILSLQIVSRANKAGLELAVKQLFQHQTIADLAAAVETVPAVAAEQGVVTGPVPLTPIQWRFLEQELPEPQHFSWAMLLEVRQPVAPAILERALQHLLIHHDSLRLCFARHATGWQQVNGGLDTPAYFRRLDLSALSAAEQEQAIATAAADLQSGLNLEHGSLVRAAWFERGSNQPDYLLLVIHHLAVDRVSWRILLEDLETACEQLNRGQAVALPAKTTAFQSWAQRLTEHLRSGALQSEAAYSLDVRWTHASALPLDHPGGLNTVGSARTVRTGLNVEETAILLTEVPQVYQTQINDVLLTAVLLTFNQWTGARTVLIDLEGHGRETLFDGVDLSRTVGWFTSIFPVLLELADIEQPGQDLKAVKEELRKIPIGGLGYGLFRYLSQDGIAQQLRTFPQAEVSFNYLGQIHQVGPETGMFVLAQEQYGPTHNLQEYRRYKLNINGSVIAGQLEVEWTYSEHLHRSATVEHLARTFLDALRSLISHCQSPNAGGHTPSDFPLARLDANKLKVIERQVL